MIRQSSAYKFTRTFASLSAVLLLTLASARAQGNDASLIIRVKGPTGEAIANAQVTINQVDCECGRCPDGVTCGSQCCDCRQTPCVCCIDTLTAVTSDDGKATFDVHEGLYKAKVEVTGFAPMQQDGIKVTKGRDNVVEITFGGGSVEDLKQTEETTKQVKQVDTTVKASEQAIQALTVKVTGQDDAPLDKVVVRIRRLGCNCGACPPEKSCVSTCCDCQGSECVCCIDTSDVTNALGIASVDLPPGTYELNFRRDGKSFGTLSGVVVTSKRRVKIPAFIQ